MMREDYREKWTADLKPGDEVILSSHKIYDDSGAKRVKVIRIGHNFVQIEGGRKFSRRFLRESGVSGWYVDRIERFTAERWKELLAEKAEVQRESRRRVLRRAIIEALTPASNDTELEKLEQIAGILDIAKTKEGE